MAEPAWVLGARRTRARRYRPRPGAPLRFQRMPAVAERLRRVLPGGLIAWMFVLLWLLVTPRARRVAQAACAARAILDGYPAQGPEIWPPLFSDRQVVGFPQQRPRSGTALHGVQTSA